MAKTLKDLALALLNATLILIALCLFLAWKASDTINGMMTDFASSIEVVKPMREEVQGMTTQLTGLRDDLQALKDGTADIAAMDRLETQLTAINERADKIGARLDALEGKPQELLDHAIEKGAQQAAATFNDIRGCTPGTPMTAATPDS